MKDIVGAVRQAGLVYGDSHGDLGDWATFKEINAVTEELGITQITQTDLAKAVKDGTVEKGVVKGQTVFRSGGQIPPPYGGKKEYDYEPPGQNGEPRGGAPGGVGVPLPMPDIRQILL